jgi:hypothetical protein
MKLAKTAIGIFQLRSGRQASIHMINEKGEGIGLLLPVSAQGEPEMGHKWKADGEYSVSSPGVPHMLDLIQHTSPVPRLPDSFSNVA